MSSVRASQIPDPCIHVGIAPRQNPPNSPRSLGAETSPEVQPEAPDGKFHPEQQSLGKFSGAAARAGLGRAALTVTLLLPGWQHILG